MARTLALRKNRCQRRFWPTRMLEAARMAATKKRLGAEEAPSRLAEALAERDAALRELAKVKVELDTVRRALATRGEADPKSYPPRAGPEGAPLRYRVADEVNDTVKAVLAPLKTVMGRVRKGGRR